MKLVMEETTKKYLEYKYTRSKIQNQLNKG